MIPGRPYSFGPMTCADAFSAGTPVKVEAAHLAYDRNVATPGIAKRARLKPWISPRRTLSATESMRMVLDRAVAVYRMAREGDGVRTFSEVGGSKGTVIA